MTTSAGSQVGLNRRTGRNMLPNAQTPPKPFRFSRGLFLKWYDRFWRCPTRLATTGLFAAVWRDEGTVRGGGGVTSVLLVLALHAWQAKRTDKWTRWAYLSRRRIAALSGLSTHTVGLALRRLQKLGWVQLRSQAVVGHAYARRTEYRLAGTMYARRGEPFVEVFGALVYGGWWSLLPTAASRQLFLVITCMDPIRDEYSYALRVGDELREGDMKRGKVPSQTTEEWLAGGVLADPRVKARMRAVRRTHPLSFTDLERLSGMARPTVNEAIKVLCAPCSGEDGSLPLVRRGKAPARSPTWYAPHRDAVGWGIRAHILNIIESKREFQTNTWGHLLARHTEKRRGSLRVVR